MDLTLVTCLNMPEPDHDEQPLLDALAAAGVEARMAAWDDPLVDWSAAPLTVLRSTWNYAEDRDGFLSWARRVSAMPTVLRNPLGVISANTHKSYLAGLERTGLPVVPTRWLARGSDGVGEQWLGELGWEQVIIKPAVGGGSTGVRAFDLSVSEELAEAAAHAGQLRLRGEVLVQPRLESIVEHGERDIVWIDGECTHVVTKLTRMAGDEERCDSVELPTPADISLVERVLRTVPEHTRRDLLYARVDLAADSQGEPRIVEVELVEPSLFVAMHEPAMQRLVAALAFASGVTDRVPSGHR